MITRLSLEKMYSKRQLAMDTPCMTSLSHAEIKTYVARATRLNNHAPKQLMTCKHAPAMGVVFTS